MKHLFLSLLFCGLSQAAPVKLIFDTDMGNDVDDLMALCMIHNLQKRGACELLAVTVTKDHPQAAAFVEAPSTARPMNTASAPVPILCILTICTRQFCISWDSITNV